MRRRLTTLAVAGTAAFALVLSGCGGSGGEGTTSRGFDDCVENPNTCNSGERAEGGEIVWLLDGPANAYFPWSPEGGSVYTVQAIQGILPYFGQFMPDGTYQYNWDVLAEEPVKLSDDPLTVQFKIREEAVWNDGTPINADDVIILWKMSTSEKEGHCIGCRPRSTGMDIIANVEGSDDGKTVTITYKDEVADPEWFTFGSVHNIIGGLPPAHVAEQNGWDINDPEDLGEYFEFLNDNPPTFSGGPYIIEEFVIDEHVIMVPNPNWYGETPVTLDRVIKRFIDGAEDTWVPALRNGELHGGSPSGWPADVIREMLGMDNIRVHMHPGPSWAHVDINLDNKWLGEHKALRQAIFTAIDAQDIVDRVFGDLFPDATVRTNHVHGPNSPYHKDHITGTGYGSGDIERARQILADAGFEGYDGGAGALTYEGETVGPFRLRAGQSPALTTSLQLQQAALAEIGIEAIIEHTDSLGETLTSQDYDIMQFGWSGAPTFYGTGAQYWECGSGSNFGNYCNEEVDALIEQERKAKTLDESAELHDQMMEIVIDDAYVLPLYDTPVFIFVTEDYVGVRDNTNSSLRALYSQNEWGLAVTK
ncbi:MAG TPA: ABC transporter family substrate-binding protein [Natronosporangium sp.]|nr:ABC transporter family substrate-binding protein [Natronosporangium sp.]